MAAVAAAPNESVESERKKLLLAAVAKPAVEAC
jgi:hypothetical protein